VNTRHPRRDVGSIEATRYRLTRATASSSRSNCMSTVQVAPSWREPWRLPTGPLPPLPDASVDAAVDPAVAPN
jgi:hypothetical protein